MTSNRLIRLLYVFHVPVTFGVLLIRIGAGVEVRFMICVLLLRVVFRVVFGGRPASMTQPFVRLL